MQINLKAQEYITMGVISISEVPSVVVTSGARNKNRKRYKIQKLTINSYRQYQ